MDTNTKEKIIALIAHIKYAEYMAESSWDAIETSKNLLRENNLPFPDKMFERLEKVSEEYEQRYNAERKKLEEIILMFFLNVG